MAFNGTGSLINGLSGTDPNYEPKVGDGATEIMWSDRRAGTIIEATKSRVVVQRDKVKRIDDNGMSDAQSYSYEPDPNGSTAEYTKRRNGQWVRKGNPMRGGQRVAIGYRDEHYDYSF